MKVNIGKNISKNFNSVKIEVLDHEIKATSVDDPLFKQEIEHILDEITKNVETEFERMNLK